jgi:gluconate kinase
MSELTAEERCKKELAGIFDGVDYTAHLPEIQPMPPSFFLYGLPGCGKSYVGKKLAEMGYRFEEGDDWLTGDMRAALSRGEGFTPSQRDAYCDLIIERINTITDEEIHGQRRPLAVAQAMFKRKHRRRIHEKCPQISFIQVKCAEDVRLQRLEAREEGIGRELGEKMRADFQEGQDTILRTDCGGLNTRLEALVKLGYLLRGAHLSDADPPLEPLAADALAGSRS